MEHPVMPNGLPDDLLTLTATAATRLIRDGKLHPEALMDAYLDHIAARNPTVEAFAHFDSAQRSNQHQVIEAAKVADSKYLLGES